MWNSLPFSVASAKTIEEFIIKTRYLDYFYRGMRFSMPLLNFLINSLSGLS